MQPLVPEPQGLCREDRGSLGWGVTCRQDLQVEEMGKELGTRLRG